jgi:hypothetical protein
VILGILALLLGIGGMTGIDPPLFPILLVLIGADILVKVVTPDQSAYGPKNVPPRCSP